MLPKLHCYEMLLSIKVWVTEKENTYLCVCTSASAFLVRVTKMDSLDISKILSMLFLKSLCLNIGFQYQRCSIL